jgi:hypothetical protein
MTIPINDTHAIPADDAGAHAIVLQRPDEQALIDLDAKLADYRLTHADVVYLRAEAGAAGPSVVIDTGKSHIRLPRGRALTLAALIAEIADPESAALAAKTHDLAVDRRNGNVVIAVESESDVHRVYLQEGVARDLGYVLAPLTPAQRQLLIDDLTDGEK